MLDERALDPRLRTVTFVERVLELFFLRVTDEETALLPATMFEAKYAVMVPAPLIWAVVEEEPAASIVIEPVAPQFVK
jgi:hypothetical protein